PNDSGYYQFQLQGGNYTLSTQSNVPYFNWICPPSLISVNTYDTATVDLPLEITNYCPYNTVSVTSPAFPFNTTSQINVLACNNGTLFSANTSVEVELDPALSFVSSIPPPIAQNGQVLTFDLDTLDILECVGIRILAQLDTLTALGATHCVEARIFPDTICGTMPWTGARIQAHATCNNDSVVFSLENQGADMLTGKNYTVYVDDVIFRIAPFQLDSGEVMEIREEALVGATYRIEAEQEPNFPTYLGDSIAIAFFEGCAALPNGGFNVGFITQFYLGTSIPSQTIFCQENVFAYDPNDKLAQPKGYGPDHLIYNNTPLDYTIRFQNTGNDTARRVIIRDTISPLLDLNTLEVGAASHNFRYDIVRGNILRFIFDPIILPDSGANQLESNGSVSFRIQLQPNLPDGTMIQNRAGIYFDYNPPIITPYAFYTIGSDFVPLNVSNTISEILPNNQIKVWPNPFREAVHFKIEGPSQGPLRLTLTDLQGRQIRQKTLQIGNEFVLQADNWAAGVYLYQIDGPEGPLASGKLLLQP
ncbi:MAG: T9SS type A sorting domain-containing protein, partial [Bacteroidota bacterium]